MRFQIIGDSSMDTGGGLDEIVQAAKVPFHLSVEGEEFIDDSSLDVSLLLRKIAASKEVARSAAPSPFDFVSAADKQAEGVFIITIDSALSATYNSAVLACEELREQHGIKAAAIDSRSASGGESLIALEIRKLEAEGKSFEETLEAAEKFRTESTILFLLDNLDTLIKNGRMSRLTGMFASFLHIKPIMTTDSEGEIILKEKARTYKKALEKFALSVIELKRKDAKTIIVSHADCEDRAKELVSKVRHYFEEAFIVPMRGLSSLYANEGGLICVF